jgi:hypothetical protein
MHGSEMAAMRKGEISLPSRNRMVSYDHGKDFQTRKLHAKSNLPIYLPSDLASGINT